MKNQYHYVYRITNTKTNKHYYGSRSCSISPLFDLGSHYFSSSKDKFFLRDQKENPEDYKYKVIFIYPTRKLALIREICLHNKFEVGVNSRFYNRSKQSLNGFITTGRVSVKDKQGNYLCVNQNDPRYISGELVGVTKNQVLVENSNKQKFYIDKNHADFLSGKFKPVKIGYCKPGRVFSKKHRQRLSESLKGKPKTDSHIKKIKYNRSKQTGLNHPRHKYIYVTPLGEFTSPAALEPKISITKMKNFCLNCDRFIKRQVYDNCFWMNQTYSDFDNEIKGKTYRDIGFSVQ